MKCSEILIEKSAENGDFLKPEEISRESGVDSDQVANARREAAAETLLQKTAQAVILITKSAKADFRTKSYNILLKND